MPAVESSASLTQAYCSESYGVPTTSISSQLIDISQFCVTQNTRFQSEMPVLPAAEPSPKLTIVEPFDKRSRFRYKSEKGNHGVLKCNKNMPAVKLENYSGKQKVNIRAIICTNENNPRLHVHNFRGSGENGMIVPLNEKMTATFTMSVEHCGVKSKEEIILKRLKSQEQYSRTVQDERALKKKAAEEAKSIDLNSIKILFEAIEVNSRSVIAKVHSSPIFHQNDLKISAISKSSSPFTGNERIILLCSKVDKKKICIRFYELNERNEIVWQRKGSFTESDIHHQYGIIFYTPPYDGESQDKGGVKVYVQLYNSKNKSKSEKIEDNEIEEGSLSDPVEFYYYAVDDDEEGVRRKRQKTNPIEGSLDSREGLRELTSSYVDNSPQNVMSSPGNPNYTESSQGSFNRPIDHCLDNDVQIEDLSDLLTVFPPNLSMDENIDIDESVISRELGMSTHSVDPMFSSTNLFVSAPTSNPAPVISGLRLGNWSNLKPDSVAVTDGQESVSDEDKICGQIFDLSLLTKDERSDLIAKDKLRIEAQSAKPIRIVDENGNTPLHLAVSETSPSEKVFQNLLLILKRSFSDMVNQKNSRGQTPLHIAVQKNSVTAMKLLLKYAANPNIADKNGNTVIHVASKHRSSDCLQEILLSERTLNLNAINHDVLTPLQVSLISQSEQCFRTLIKAGADINIKDNRSGRTVLHLAVQHMPSVVKFILSKSVNVDEQDYAGNTALHLACLKTELDAARALMEYDANPLLPNFEEEEETASSQDKGKTAHDFAYGNPKLCCILSGEGEPIETKTTKLSLDCSKSNSNAGDLDSGYISTDEMTFIDLATRSELEKLLNPDNRWKKLSDISLGETHSENLPELDGGNPTRAICLCLEKQGWTAEYLLNALEAAELPEAYHVVKNFLNNKSQP